MSSSKTGDEIELSPTARCANELTVEEFEKRKTKIPANRVIKRLAGISLHYCKKSGSFSP